MDGDFQKIVNSGGVWRVPADVPAVFRDAAKHAADVPSPPAKISLTVSKQWQEKADKALDAVKLDGAAVVIDSRKGAVRAIATRDQTADHRNFAIGVSSDPGEIIVLLTAAAMDKNGLESVTLDQNRVPGCTKFSAIVQYSCRGSASALKDQLSSPDSLSRAQTIACALGFDGHSHPVNGVEIAVSSVPLGENCSDSQGLSAAGPVSTTPFQMVWVAAALAARSINLEVPCPHFVEDSSEATCSVRGQIAYDGARYVRGTMAEKNDGVAMMISSLSVGSGSSGWAVGFAPVENPTVAVAVHIDGTTNDATVVLQAASKVAKELLSSAH
jgi:hypothetical protein